MKAGELEKRGEKRAEALAAIEKAKEDGDMDEVDKQSRRIVKVSSSLHWLVLSFLYTFYLQWSILSIV